MTQINYSTFFTNVLTNVTLANIAETSSDFDAMRILQIIISSVGIIANFTVVFVFVNHKQLRAKIPNMFIINQSCIDFCASVTLFLLGLTVGDPTKTHSKGFLGQLECRLWNTEFVLWGFLFASTWNIVCMTLERYLELVHPIWHKTHFKIQWIYMAFVAIWLLNMILATFEIFISKAISGVCYVYAFWPSPLVKSIFGVCMLTVSFFIPLIILIYCYGRIVWILTRRIDSKISSSGASDKFHLARTNTIKTLLTVALCFVICWSNIEILSFLYYISYYIGFENFDWNSTYFNFTIFMVFMNCTINPFIYIIKYKDFQDALRHFGSRSKAHSHKASVTAVSSNE